MARKTIYLDDMESGEVEADAGTITFALENVTYELDLSTKNATKLRNQLAPWISAARKPAGRPHPVAKKASGGSGYNSEQQKAIREWAGRNGFTVSAKGRIPGEVIHAFEQSQAPSPTFSG